MNKQTEAVRSAYERYRLLRNVKEHKDIEVISCDELQNRLRSLKPWEMISIRVVDEEVHHD